MIVHFKDQGEFREEPLSYLCDKNEVITSRFLGLRKTVTRLHLAMPQ